MIGRLISWLRALRIAHHHRRMQAAGAAALEAYDRRDWDGAERHMRTLNLAQRRRNYLQALARTAEARANWLHADGETCPPCTHNCCEGRACSARRR